MKNVSPKIEVIIPLYRWHTQMFDNMIVDLSSGDSLKRIEGRTNHLVWVAGNIVNCRYWLASVLGLADADPNENLFKDAKALDEAADYPALEDLKKNWHDISKKIYEKLLEVTDKELSEPYDFGMSVEFVEENRLNMIGMAMDRVSYLLGQAALLRRAIANLGTKYEVNKDLNY